MLTTLTMGVMNIVPWGGPCGRTAAALEVGTSEIWRYCIPAQVVGIVLILGLCVLLSRNEKKRGAGYNPAAEAETVSVETVAEVNELHRPKLFWFNIALIVAVVLMLTMTKVATHITFMIALAIGLTVNYPSQKMQMERVKAHATDALTMAFTALASGVLIGIMGKSPMLDAMTQMVLSAMPESMAPHLHVLFAAVNSPLSMFIHGDALTYGILPIVNQIVSVYGIPAAAVGAAFLITFGPGHLHHAHDCCYLHGPWPDQCGTEGSYRLLLQVGIRSGKCHAGLRSRHRHHSRIIRNNRYGCLRGFQGQLS